MKKQDFDLAAFLEVAKDHKNLNIYHDLELYSGTKGTGYSLFSFEGKKLASSANDKDKLKYYPAMKILHLENDISTSGIVGSKGNIVLSEEGGYQKIIVLEDLKIIARSQYNSGIYDMFNNLGTHLFTISGIKALPGSYEIFSEDLFAVLLYDHVGARKKGAAVWSISQKQAIISSTIDVAAVYAEKELAGFVARDTAATGCKYTFYSISGKEVYSQDNSLKEVAHKAFVTDSGPRLCIKMKELWAVYDLETAEKITNPFYESVELKDGKLEGVIPAKAEFVG
ncbi:MAG: hypothetical protein JWM20_428 [Patescibacteria group bacterium]|nr:hypothetical protein [Patescibacteria group bacterium]